MVRCVFMCRCSIGRSKGIDSENVVFRAKLIEWHHGPKAKLRLGSMGILLWMIFDGAEIAGGYNG